MWTASRTRSNFVGHRTHISARGDSRHKMRARAIQAQDFKLFDLHLHRPEQNLFLLPRQFVSGHALDFLRRIGRRSLLNLAQKVSSQIPYLFESERWSLRLPDSRPFGIVGVGCEAKANHAFEALLGSQVELRQPG